VSARSPKPGLATLVVLALSIALVIFVARRSIGGVIAVIAIAGATRIAGVSRRSPIARRLP
jgi:hypothetical protein